MIFKIFVSGNQTELKEERMAIKETISGTPIIKDFFDPFLFEDVPATGRDAVSTYLEEVKRSDIYIGILGNSYGKKCGNNISATETEYNTFIESINNGEVLIFVKGHDDDGKDPEVITFFEKTKMSSIYNRFESIDELKESVIESLESFLKSEGLIAYDTFDNRINNEATFDDMNEDELMDFLKKRATNLDVEVPTSSMISIFVNVLKVLKEVRGELKPTNVGILFFSPKASDYIPQHEIKIARFKGVTRTDIIDSEEIKGPIYKVIDEVENFFRRNTRIANKIVDFKRIDIPEYPYPAIREALINAIAHRDYNRTGAPILFSIYDDRVEISSPGTLVSGVTLKDIEGRHETRNEKICEIFKLTKDMETFGTGISKMKSFMLEYGLQEPEFRLEGNFFVVRFYGPGKNIGDLVSSIPEERMTDLKDLGLNKRQIRALKIMLEEGKVLTNAWYQKEFEVSRHTASRDLKGLVDKQQVYVVGKAKGTKYKAKDVHDA